MPAEVRNCQNCKKDFTIEPDDFGFYEKMKVPAPTWCPTCRFQRRMVFRNERALFKRTCDAPGHSEEMISMYAPQSGVKVYDYAYWWSDAWDPMSYGRDYDFSRPFFEQFHELLRAVPWPALNVLNNVNSQYCNFCTDNKNCYLVFGGDFNEDCAYSTFNFHSKEAFDTYWIDKCELCYECVDSANNYRVLFSRYAYDCVDSAFLLDCVGCQNCFGCVGLRKKQYCIFNEQYSKEEYAEKIAELDLSRFRNVQRIAKKFYDFQITKPKKYAAITRSVNATGNDIHNAKNCTACFDIEGDAENLRHTYLAGWGLRDAHSTDHAGHGSELVYDSFGVFAGARNVAFSIFSASCQDCQYSYVCRGSSNLFGCAGVRNKKYCILNKQYTKEEYEALVPKIIAHMNEMPYRDTTGKTYTYGEFFPPSFSPFAYNESLANEYFPLSKSEAEVQGLVWREPAEKSPVVTMRHEDLPDSIDDVTESILKETISCAHSGDCKEQCTKAFRIIPAELQLYKRLRLPLPRFCPNCRHYQRFRLRNPFKLYNRSCMKTGCHNEFEATYAPDRPDIIYCEACYQNEVA